MLRLFLAERTVSHPSASRQSEISFLVQIGFAWHLWPRRLQSVPMSPEGAIRPHAVICPGPWGQIPAPPP